MYRLGGGRGGEQRMHGMTTKRKERKDTYVVWDTEEWSRDMSALLTFRRRHVGWQHGSSAEEDDKYKAVKWK